MTTVSELHDRAMLSLDRSRELRAKRKYDAADLAAKAAFVDELEAAQKAFDLDVSIATRVILLRSLGYLARESKSYGEGIDLALRALNTPDLVPHRAELLGILDTLRTYEHLAADGVELVDTDLQLSVSGLEAAPGFARADEVSRRVEHVRNYMIRSAMRRDGLPFSPSLATSRRYRDAFVPWLSVSRSQSYAVTLRFGVVEQTELALGNEDKAAPAATVRAAIDDLMTAAAAFAQGGPESIWKLISDESYAKNAVQLLNHLSPDSERVATVGLTVQRDGAAKPIALPPRQMFKPKAPPPLRLQDIRGEALPPPTITVVGRLLEGRARKPDSARATVFDDTDHPFRFTYDEAAFGDVIGGYWKHRVRAVLRRDKGSLTLADIDNA